MSVVAQREVFDGIDMNRDGTVDLEELVLACRREPRLREYLGLPEESPPVSFPHGPEGHDPWEEAFQAMGAAGSGGVSWVDFHRFLESHEHLYAASGAALGARPCAPRFLVLSRDE